jgi:hypothetical protein
MSVGFFLGVSIMMALNMLSLFLMFIGAIYLADVKDKAESAADQAAASFAFCLMVLYGTFSWVLARNRRAIIKEE